MRCIACGAEMLLVKVVPEHTTMVPGYELKGNETLIARRIATRHEHFMPLNLLHSQFEALEEPGPDDAAIIASIEPEPREIATRILTALNMVEGGLPPEQAL